MQKKAMFRYLAEDGKHTRSTALNIINRLSERYCIKTSPPSMFSFRIDPYGLVYYHKSFKWIMDPIKLESMRKAVHGVWKLDGTRSRKQKKEIKKQIKSAVDNKLLRSRLKDMINIPAKRWVAEMFGVKYLIYILQKNVFIQ